MIVSLFFFLKIKIKIVFSLDGDEFFNISSTLIIIVEIKKKNLIFLSILNSSLSILIDILFALHILSGKVFQFYLELFL